MRQWPYLGPEAGYSERGWQVKPHVLEHVFKLLRRTEALLGSVELVELCILPHDVTVGSCGLFLGVLGSVFPDAATHGSQKGRGVLFTNKSNKGLSEGSVHRIKFTGTSHNTGSRKKQNTRYFNSRFLFFIQLHNNNKWPTCLFLLCSLSSTYYRVGRWNSGSTAHDLSDLP